MAEFSLSCHLGTSAVALMNSDDTRSHQLSARMEMFMLLLNDIHVSTASLFSPPLPVCPPPASPDELVDCMDPDCCAQISCQGQTYCRGSPDPVALASQSQGSASQTSSRSFYDRVSFLIGPSGSHVVPWDNVFNSR